MTKTAANNNSEVIEFDDLVFHFATREEYCVSTHDDEPGERFYPKIWLPKALVEKDGNSFFVPLDLAKEKGLL